jgi:arylsulfatase A-like enzyme
VVKRRELLEWALASTALAGCGGSGGTSGTRRPNLLVIAIDDLNDWVGFLGGHPQTRTPHLDALAAKSTVFERAYCSAPVCAASRAGALSGLSVQSTGVADNDSTFKAKNPGKREYDEMLAAAGYVTRRFGKVDHNYDAFPQPLPVVTPYSNKRCAPANDIGAFDWGPIPGGDEDMPDWHYAQQGIDFLAQQAEDEPFCLSVGFFRPHVGWYVPQRYFDLFPHDGIIVPKVPMDDLDDVGPQAKAVALKWNFHQCIVGQSLWSEAVRGYLAAIAWADAQLGRLMDAFEKSPHAANTVVVLWSDHGFHLGEKFHWHKQALWEHTTRVPFLMRLPGQTTGHRQTSCVSLTDMAPTLLELAGVAPDYPMDGSSLTRILRNPGQHVSRHAVTTLYGVHHAVRDDRWRFIRYQGGTEIELYDELNDPDEYANLAYLPAYADQVARLSALLPAV